MVIDERNLTPEQIAIEEDAGMPLDWGLVKKYDVPMEPDHIRTIISLLRNGDRPQSHAKLMDDAASALEDYKAISTLWDEFESLQSDDEIIEATNQSIIDETEGNSNMDRCAACGDWDRIFDLFIEEVRKRLLASNRIRVGV